MILLREKGGEAQRLMNNYQNLIKKNNNMLSRYESIKLVGGCMCAGTKRMSILIKYLKSKGNFSQL